jgi:hypothetical protein
MNLKEFAALKPGDKIENLMSGRSVGEVASIDEAGVRIRWGDGGPAAPAWFYGVNSTAWFHWTKIEPDCPGQPAPVGF